MNVVIIGLGLIGGSLAIDLRLHGFATKIIGVDTNRQHAEEGIRLGLVDEIQSLDEACVLADLIIIATPVDVIKELLPKVLSIINARTTVVDLGSTKKSIGALVENHPLRRNYIAAHPMSGTENSGPSAALPNLFENKVCIICDHELSSPQHLALCEKMFQTIGATIAYTSSLEQDHTTAYISHLPHVVAYALANAVMAEENSTIIFDLASGGFNSTVRLAKSDPTMWVPIFEDNRVHVLESIDCYMKHLNELRNSIAQGNKQQMFALMNRAVGIRQVLSEENASMVKNERKITKLYKR